MIGAAAVLVYAVTVAAVETSRRDALSRAAAQNNLVAATAAAEGQALSTYDYRDLAPAKDRILALATGAFAEQEAADYPAVAAGITGLKATGSARIEESLASLVGPGRADAFVVVATTVDSTAGVTTATQYLRMALVLVGSEWKVAGVQPLSPAPS